MPAANYTVSATFLAIDKMSQKMITMGRAAQKFGTKTQAHFARAEMAMRNMGRGITKLTKRFGSLGLVLGGSLIIGGLSNMVDKFASFEQANATLASVMASATQPELEALQNDAKRLGAITAKSATEVVGLQEAYARLGFGAKDIINMTESTIAGSVAMQGELADTAELVGAMVRSFDKLDSRDAPMIIDQMTRSTQQSALNFEKLQVALPIVAKNSDVLGNSFSKTLAYIGKLSDAGFDASVSGTALRKMFSVVAKKGIPLDKMLQQIATSENKLKTAFDLFGQTAMTQAVVLADNLQKTEELSESLIKGAGAQEAAAKQLDTLKGRLTILGSAWEGFILSVESGNGKIGKFLKTTIEVATELLSLASGSAKARDELTEGELVIRKIAERVIKFGKVIGILIAQFALLKVAIIANRAILAGAKFLKFVGIFIKIARAQGIWTAAQWALNIAMNANPISLIILGIAALITGIILLVKNWKDIVAWVKESDNWFAKLIRFYLKPIIFLFQLIAKAWNAVKEAFKSGKIGDFFKRIGKNVMNFLLTPLEMVLKIASKLTKGKIGGDLLERIQNARASMNAEPLPEPSPQLLTTTGTSAAREQIIREESIKKQQASILIKKEKGVNIETDIPLGAPIKLTDTF